jgi:LPLT family lysophospholipid transporter-like MFS transporter
LYALSTSMGLSAFGAISVFGAVVASFMWLIKRWHAYNLVHHRQEVERLLFIARHDETH